MKIALVDDHILFRSGLKSLLLDIPNVTTILEAGDGEGLIDILKNHSVDIILLDLEMPGMSGFDVLPVLKKMMLETKIIVISMHPEENFVSRAMELGAHGYLLKDVAFDELELALSSVLETGFYFNERVSKSLLSSLVNKQKIVPHFQENTQLTEREMEILKLICQEYTTSEIAQSIYLSTRTIEGYRARLLEKSGARNSAGLVVYAAKKGWLDHWLE